MIFSSPFELEASHQKGALANLRVQKLVRLWNVNFWSIYKNLHTL